jgi:hypothetical protein
MQPTGRTGAEFRPGGAFRWRREGSVGLCGRRHEGPQLMRISLGSSAQGHDRSIRWQGIPDGFSTPEPLPPAKTAWPGYAKPTQ